MSGVYHSDDIPEDLRSYFVRAEIGLEDTPDAYVERLVEVFREVRRVLRDDGTLFLNLGDSYFAGGARRAAPCGTSGKAPGGYPASDCLCESLCDACQRAYRLGKSHSDARHAPKLGASISASSPSHKGSPSGHLPTSGSALPVGRTAAAIPDPAPSSSLAGGRPLGAPVSTTAVSSQPPQAEPPLSDQPSGCLLCGRSLQRSALASVHKGACNCGTSEPASGLHNSGMGAWGSAYPHLATKSLKPKDLIGIPWRAAFALQADGWFLRQELIWAKPNPMPESVRDRCTRAHEQIFMFAKSGKPTIWRASDTGEWSSSPNLSERVAHPTDEDPDATRARWRGFDYFYDADSIKNPPSDALLRQIAEGYRGSDTKDYGEGGAQSASGTKSRIIENARKKIDKQRGHSRRHAGFNERWDALSKSEQAALGSNKRSVWTVAPKPFKEAHFATYPPDLIEPCILAGCPVGGTVLDPFFGAGTTGLVAQNNGREWIGIELNPAYAEIARKRLGIPDEDDELARLLG